MSRREYSAAQRTLIDALRRIETLPLGPSEPALTFRLQSWAAAAGASFDLEASAMAAGPLDHEAGPARPGSESSEPRKAADSQASPPPTSIGQISESLVEIARGVSGGEADPRQIAGQALERIGALNPRLNAIVATTPDRALAEAGTIVESLQAGERPPPLAGVPILHKDIICTRDTPTTAGSELLRGYVPSTDAAVVARLANAGTLLVGKTNTHEFATGTTGTVSCFGPALNPWDTQRITGGSSSGAAAALAAGLVPAATGTDTGGSIRIPSACCGTAGLKPTYGRVSRTGVIPFAWSLDHVGPMARNVADVAALLTVMCGYDPTDAASASEPTADFGAQLPKGIAGLRFSIPRPHFLQLAREDVAAAVEEAAAVLERLGARRVEVELPDEMAEVGPAAVAIFLAEGGSVHARTLKRRPEAYQKETLAFLSLAGEVSGLAYVQAQRVRARLLGGMLRVLQSTDLLLTPTLPITAPRLDQKTVEGPAGPMDVRAALTLFTRPFNLTGLPALSLPCGFDDEGMPIGLQIIGRPFDEAAVLRAGHAFESATEWQARRPAM
jgi:aspartyl-tRNA(Asn)/glutamyl-tRNA(Gln) amidotransferase subunit A